MGYAAFFIPMPRDGRKLAVLNQDYYQAKRESSTFHSGNNLISNITIKFLGFFLFFEKSSMWGALVRGSHIHAGREPDYTTKSQCERPAGSGRAWFFSFNPFLGEPGHSLRKGLFLEPHNLFSGINPYHCTVAVDQPW